MNLMRLKKAIIDREPYGVLEIMVNELMTKRPYRLSPEGRQKLIANLKSRKIECFRMEEAEPDSGPTLPLPLL